VPDRPIMYSKYRCNGCELFYDTAQDAQDCTSCYPDEYYFCGVCDQFYFDEDLARECEEGHT